MQQRHDLNYRAMRPTSVLPMLPGSSIQDWSCKGLLVVLLQGLLRNPRLVIGRGCWVVLSLIALSLTGCGPDGQQGPTISTGATPAGATVNLAWDPADDASVIGYYIHYGRQSSNRLGSCAYEQKQFVSSNQGAVTKLGWGLIYYFAVSAYNGLESLCSNEVFTITLPPPIACCPSR